MYIKRSHLTSEWQFNSERSNCPQHIEKEALQDYIKTGDMMPDCPATMPRGPGTPPLIPAYNTSYSITQSLRIVMVLMELN